MFARSGNSERLEVFDNLKIHTFFEKILIYKKKTLNLSNADCWLIAWMIDLLINWSRKGSGRYGPGWVGWIRRWRRGENSITDQVFAYPSNMTRV